MKYSKPALSIPDQISRLKAIGLAIGVQATAEHALRFIGHFRLKGYFLPFMNPPMPPLTQRTFMTGTTIEQVLDLYQFDRKLRLLLLAQIERLEVAIRTVICNELSLQFGPHWYVSHAPQVFGKGFPLYEFLHKWDADARREKNPFTKHYYDTYTDPPIPPSWAIAECVSFGKWSQLYQSLKVGRSAISSAFHVPTAEMFQSWLHALTVLRNVCAHHARAWDRLYAIQPKKHQGYASHFLQPTTIYACVVVIRILSLPTDPANDFHASLKQLLAQHPSVPLAPMGFPATWVSDPLWN